jgi:hypothetical protein
LHEKLAVWTRVAAVLAAVAIGALLFTIKSDLVSVSKTLADRPAETNTVINREASMISFQKSWESAECGTVTVLTVCGIDYNGNPIPGGETLAECIERHRTTVARLMAECPPA